MLTDGRPMRGRGTTRVTPSAVATPGAVVTRGHVATPGAVVTRGHVATPGAVVTPGAARPLSGPHA
jgi:hypothetical protein